MTTVEKQQALRKRKICSLYRLAYKKEFNKTLNGAAWSKARAGSVDPTLKEYRSPYVSQVSSAIGSDRISPRLDSTQSGSPSVYRFSRMDGTSYGQIVDSKRDAPNMHFTQFKMPKLLAKLEGNKS